MAVFWRTITRSTAPRALRCRCRPRVARSVETLCVLRAAALECFTVDLADEVVILNEGRIVQRGTPREVTRAPANAFVMQFLGDSNRLSVDVRDGVARLGDIAIPAPGVGDGKAGLFVRPRDVDYVPAGKGLPVTVRQVLDRPDSRRLVAATDGGEMLEFDVRSDVAVNSGDRGSIAIRDGRVFVD